MTREQRDQASLLLLGVVLLVPLILWQSAVGADAWRDTSSILRSVGQVGGVLGACLFSVNFILAARLRWLEEIIGGLPKIYSLHHAIGGVALILLLIHPLFLGLQYVPQSIESAALFFIPDPNNLPKLFGLIALDILILLLVITFFIRIAYHKWKSTHQWMGLALLFAGLHVYLIPGNLSSSPLLRTYMVGIIILGITAFTYRVLLGRWLVSRHSYEVMRVADYGGAGVEVFIKPLGNHVSYKSGQFFFLQVRNDSTITREPHPFSFTSPPGPTAVSFAAKPLGDYTSRLKRLQPGTKLKIEGPYGRFLFSEGGPRQVWIAGGIGVTPFMSRVRELPLGSEQNITFYYSVRNKDEALFIDELRAVEEKTVNFQLIVHESELDGHLTMGDSRGSAEGQDHTYFICGPVSMIQSIKNDLIARGVKRSRIFTEEFKLY